MLARPIGLLLLSACFWIRSTGFLIVQKPCLETPRIPFHHPTRRQCSNAENVRSVHDIQQEIVKCGLAWEQAPLSLFQMGHMPTRVPGCTATVNILAERHWSGIHGTDLVSIRGHSDAVFSRGLLARLAERLHNQTVKQVLGLKPDHMADDLQVRPALTAGRSDALANMLSVVQQQLQNKPLPNTVHRQIDTNETQKQPSVALLLSGGVDSAVAMHLLRQQGYNVTAFYLKIWLEDELEHLGDCPWEDDVTMCQKICDQAKVPLNIVSLQDDYHRHVMQHTLREASQGRTPNPDILCNSRVKFGCFLEHLDNDDYDFVASGHYAQLVRRTDSKGEATVHMVRAPDPVKDQSYFLCTLNQTQFQRLLFPIGHLNKTQVRQLAEDWNLPNRHRPDSQGLCFLGKISFRDFLGAHLGVRPGDIVDSVTGEQIGRHDGVWYHTVGQRKGIGQSLFPLATSRGPWYVVAKDTSNNIVYASNRYNDDVFTKTRSEFHVENIHWICGRPQSSGSDSHELWFKIRHGPRLVRGVLNILSCLGEGIVKLEEKDGGLAPGQQAVFYDDKGECLGGGIISERHWATYLSSLRFPTAGDSTSSLR